MRFMAQLSKQTSLSQEASLVMADRPKNEKLNHFQARKMAAKETIGRKGKTHARKLHV